MIKLLYPRSNQVYYLFLMGVLYGPFDLSGQYELEEFTRRDSGDTLSERDGIYGENDVEHIKLEGEVTYVPPLIPPDYHATPNPTYPASANVRLYQNGRWNTYSVDGIAGPSRSFISLNASYALCQCATDISGSRSCRFASIQVHPSNPRVLLAWDYHEYTLSSHDGKTMRITDRTVYARNLPRIEGTIDWSKTQSANTIFDHREKGATYVERSQTYDVTVYRGQATDMSPAQIMSTLSMRIQRDILELSTLKPIDYGELAMLASSKVIANQVNMIAFIGDLRDPSSLIPKLKNLRKLKTYGNAYLTYKYGVLPTISDLEEIVTALKGRKPYIDTNGFKTYNARHSQSESIHKYSIDLEQRIKLAIDTEDNALEAAIQALENIGVFPTLNNIWDLIPYSFVLDWFIDIGDYLERVDTRLRLLRLNIRYVTMSQRMTAKIDAARLGYPLVGWAGKVHYHRWVSDQCPVPSLYSQSKPESFQHWLEGGALLLQRTK